MTGPLTEKEFEALTMWIVAIASYTVKEKRGWSSDRERINAQEVTGEYRQAARLALVGETKKETGE
jgi:hypothetical protein